jgi:Major capsid protein Gp23
MSALKTYDREWSDGGPPEGDPWPFVLVEGCGDPNCDPIAPGCWVTHRSWGGFGMVIAITADQLTILWSEEPRGPRFMPPLVKRVSPGLIANQLLSVQPMTAPVGAVFYLDYVYGSHKLDPRCTTGSWWSRLFWRAWLCTSTRTQSWWRSFSCWVRSWSTRKSTSVASEKPVDFEAEVVREWVQGCHLTRGGQTPFGRTRGPFEGPPAAPEKAPTDRTG